MSHYEIHRNAGTINYANWYNMGIMLPAFDKDGTLTSANTLKFDPEVMEGLKENLVGVYSAIAIASNNHDAYQIRAASDYLEDELGVEVF